MRLVSILLVLLTACSAPQAGPAAPGAAAGDSGGDRRRVVERGLLPAVVLAGRAEPRWTVEERMERYRVPGLGVAVIDDGAVAWAAGYGVARAGGAVPITASTLFQAASISKAVTAAGALRLVQDGQLGLDEDVGRRLRSWRLPFADGVAPAPVTLRHLLSHSAGVTVGGFPGYRHGAPLPTPIQILDGAAPANSRAVRVDETPGGRYRYSGGGYQVVELLLAEVTGRPFASLLDELVLAPAGMERSTFAQPLPAALADAAAHGHGFDGAPVPGGWHVYPERAAAGLWSTPADLARFAVALLRAFRGEPNRLLAPATARRMLTTEMGTMGLGVGVHDAGDALHFDHAGWNRGTRTYLVAYPAAGDGIVVMANGDGGHELIAEVVRAAARVYGWPHFAPERRRAVTVDPAVLDGLVGRWHMEPVGFEVTVIRAGNHLLLATPRGSRYTFHPASTTEFFALEDGATLRVRWDAEEGPEMQLWGSTGRRGGR
ncbi:MAG TPA: serine hydrolase domain-containing protein [Thermoanaerobaculia bacterium]|nr:serine hydrolase domain-containing protein [Thermoanaerobaculia bacterium]